MSQWKIPQHFKVIIGGNNYIDCPTIINYKGQNLFSLYRSEENDFLGIDFDLYDSAGSKIATIRNGQFVGSQPNGYKIHGNADHYLLVEEANNRHVCEIKLRNKAAGEAELEVSAEMYMPDGKLISFSPEETNLGGIKMKGNTFQGCGAAIVIN